VINVRHLRELARTRLLAAIPSIDPVDGAPIVGCYCYRTYPDAEFHPGVDLAADYGETVRAAADGTVVANWYDGGYGIKIDIDHGNGYHTWYAHLSHAGVAVGAHVTKGEPIGLVGNTGFSTGPHLHYQIMYDGAPVNPTPFLNGVPANVLASLP
jgi:murein DD-endopeptidase MepM/ murein hydrolase activator NlpD